jgi:branched-chain amino acid transport system ATP-binding protein
MLELKNITTHYGRAQILNGLSITVRAGECVALLGRNGAGKSTTMKTIMGLVQPTDGQVLLNDRDITDYVDYQTAQAGIGYVPEERRIFPDLTVLENLEVGRKEAKSSDNPWTIERVYDLFPKLIELKNRLGGHLSGGEQQMLTVARSLMGNPSLLLLDEPTEGLAPIIVQQMVSSMGELKKQGLSILISEQNQRAIASLCDRAYILEKGEIVFEETMAFLQNHPSVSEQYLGAH